MRSAEPVGPVIPASFHPGRAARRGCPAARRALWHLIVALGLWLLPYAGSAAQTGSAALPYALGPGDRLKVSLFEREDLSGEVTVRPSGSISIPLIGEIQARGLSLLELEDRIIEKLHEAVQSKPIVIIEIIKYRPFYILGHVNNPGSYPYVPNITVIQAVAIAGGFFRLDPKDIALRIEVVRARESLQRFQQAYWAALIKESRLLAERDGRDEIDFPQEALTASDPERIADLIEAERRIFEERKRSIAEQIEHMNTRAGHLEKEIGALGAQVRLLDRQLGELRTFLGGIEDLRKKGFATTARSLELSQTVVQTESTQLAVKAAILRERQGRAALLQAIDKRIDDFIFVAPFNAKSVFVNTRGQVWQNDPCLMQRVICFFESISMGKYIR